ncbi:MAG: hypothetical protein GX452_02580 [Ignavibacteriales bacterium]|mgnify:FL=1|jgi:hypothetical protein|nr:hypothetical protein [Ignavibacteriales bacterium]HPO54707.1 hypothetical protein [Ignavibacteriaceae bacterium]
MAIIYQNPNGKIVGKLGPIYAKMVKGRNIFAIMPIPTGRLYESLTDQYKKFRTAVKFASALSAFPKLKKLNESLRGRFFSGYNALVSKNLKFVGIATPSDNCTIVVEGFGFAATDIAVSETAVSATVPAMDSLTEIPEEAANVRFLGSVVYSDAVDPNDEPFMVTTLEKEVQNYNFSNPYSFSHNLSAYQLGLAEKYQRKTVYLAAVIESETGARLLNSSSVAGSV